MSSSDDRTARPQRCTSAKPVANFHGIPVVLRCEREEGHRGIHLANEGDTWKSYQWPR